MASHCDLLAEYRATYGTEPDGMTVESFVSQLRLHVERLNKQCPLVLTLEVFGVGPDIGRLVACGQMTNVLVPSLYDFQEMILHNDNIFTDFYYDPVLAMYYSGELWWKDYDPPTRRDLKATINWTLHATGYEPLEGVQEYTVALSSVCIKHNDKVSLECKIAIAGIKESIGDHLLPELLPIVYGYVAPDAVRKRSASTK